ncbi:hypothetical protein ACFYQT_35490 [Streptomyces tibetensis]|uniref:Uncharacterized protein n=1 Tax=Streptomyces tibetensis TaxID=2382123 RepID=A0ABW6N656_9ACTN
MIASAARERFRHSDVNGPQVSPSCLDVEEPPADIVAALNWIGRKSVDVTDLTTPSVVRVALDAQKLKQDGTAAAENTVNRKRTVFSNCLRYATERELLTALPLDKVDWAPPETDDEIDLRFVPGPKLAKPLIDAVGEQGERGRNLCLFWIAPGDSAEAVDEPRRVTDG